MLKLILAVLLLLPPLAQAQKLEQIVAEAKKEGEVTLVASTSTFGGKKGFTELEALFAKRYGFKAKLNLSGGPSFPQMAARIITEQKAGSKSSTDMYLGSDGTFATMQEEKALEKVNWAGTFPWVTKEMEIIPQESLLVYASFHGIIYNSNVIPKDKAPKSYEDLIDPALSPTWAGKMAIPAYIHWLIRLIADLGQGESSQFCAQAGAAHRRPAAPGRRRAHRQRRISDHGEHRRAARGDVEVANQRRAAGRLAGIVAGELRRTINWQCRRNSVHPNMAKLFIAFMTTREAQSVLEKQDYRSSHLVEGTILANYVKANKIKLQDAKQLSEVFQKEDAGLEEELNKILLK